MCGIAGFAAAERAGAAALAKRMTDALSHRGPDGEGVWTGEGAALAHRGSAHGVGRRRAGHHL
jgi:asparagine synthase (glutamine-hydrolysing)